MDIIIKFIGEENLTPNEIILLETSLLFLISLPVVTTLAGIFRHIIGLRTLRVYAPIILTYSFYQLGKVIDSDPIEYSYVRGLVFGLILFSIVFIISAALYKLLKRIRMHYIPKSSLVLLGTSCSILLAIIIGTKLFEKKGLIYMDLFSIIMVATLSELLVSQLSRKSLKNTFIVSLQTLIAALLSYTLISIGAVRDFILDYTIVIIVIVIAVNIYVGKFMGLRISEYWRFRDLLFEETTVKNKPLKKKTNVQKSKESQEK